MGWSGGPGTTGTPGYHRDSVFQKLYDRNVYFLSAQTEEVEVWSLLGARQEHWPWVVIQEP